ncbi:MAG: serine/threonine protein kinase [Candidatus Manganitrophaceae bacterium]|nr:MAG: serine/threonine protein kinase [Candidatus Manganitrophaceae bacterium]
MNNQLFSGKYEVQEEIARGGMGVVYKAVHKSLNRLVALKVLHAQYSGDLSFLKRFQREARAMARLDHENIIRVYDVAEDQSAQYIVMEFFAGKDLKQAILENGPFSVEQALSVALQMAEALAYAHAQGIVHRDIKPSNVMLDGRGKVKLADFGIAAATDEISVTATGQIIGTPEYMSPEQARGEAIDGRSDLYSLGIVLYEMLTATTPFERLSRMSIIAKLLYEPQDFTLSFPDSVPFSLQELIRALLKKQAPERIADAATLVARIKNLAQENVGEETLDQTRTAMSPLRATPPPGKPIEEEEATAMLHRRSDLQSGAFSRSKTPAPLTSPGAEKSSSSFSPPPPPQKTKVLPTPPPLERRDTEKRPRSILIYAGIAGLVLLVGGGMYFRSSSSSGSSTDSPVPVSPPAPRPEEKPITLPAPLPMAALPEPKREEGIDSALVANVNGMEAETRKIQGEIAQSRSEANALDARHRSSQVYLQATEWESKGSKALQEGSQMIGEKQYQEAGAKLQEAKDLLVRAHQGFKKAKEESQVQIARETPSSPERKSAKKEAVLKASVGSPAPPAAPSPSGTKSIPPPSDADTKIAKQTPPATAPLPPRPDIEVVGEILSRLKSAYEGRDMAALLNMSNLSDGRARLLEEIFRDFPIVKVSIANFSLTGEIASANVVITKLVDKEGKVVPPREEWKQSKVLIRKEGNRWGKVLW